MAVSQVAFCFEIVSLSEDWYSAYAGELACNTANFAVT